MRPGGKLAQNSKNIGFNFLVKFLLKKCVLRPLLARAWPGAQKVFPEGALWGAPENVNYNVSGPGAPRILQITGFLAQCHPKARKLRGFWPRGAPKCGAQPRKCGAQPHKCGAQPRKCGAQSRKSRKLAQEPRPLPPRAPKDPS